MGETIISLKRMSAAMRGVLEQNAAHHLGAGANAAAVAYPAGADDAGAGLDLAPGHVHLRHHGIALQYPAVFKRSGNDFDRSETLRKQRIVNYVFAFDQ